MYHKAISEMIQEGLHLAGGMQYIYRASKDEYIRMLHSSYNGGKFVAMRTKVLAFHKTVGTARAEVLKVSWKEEFMDSFWL
ncbi:MAG: hypothetical protein K0R05_3297 [Anaerocolumna sp.]|nr:hypothetical protein [Anaerocolumna sp.]